MNIDYAAIIEKANARKDALQKFELAVQGLRGEINEAHEPDLISAARDFQNALHALDAEAHALLPQNTAQVLGLFVNNLLSMWAFVDKVSNSAFTVARTPRAALDILAGE